MRSDLLVSPIFQIMDESQEVRRRGGLIAALFGRQK
jgi:hypothetical protein